MKKLFFFFRDRKNKTALISNEWMTCELCQEKKNRKNAKISGKNKKQPILLKITLNPYNFEWMAYELFQGKKKKHAVFFFFPLRGKKKNKIFGFEWMNDPWTFPRKKKIRYLWFTDYLFSLKFIPLGVSAKPYS